MKKILSMVLAAVMCATMMVGCGGSQKPAETDSSKEQQSVEAEAKPEEKAEVEEKSEETQKPSKTADPNKKDIKFGITSSFRDFTDYIPEKMAQWGYNGDGDRTAPQGAKRDCGSQYCFGRRFSRR